MNQKHKRFPLFTLPAPKFLTEDLKKIDDFVVMVRVTPKITLLNYAQTVLYLLIFLSYCLILFLIVFPVVLKIPFPVLLTVVQRSGWLFVAYGLQGGMATIPPEHLKDFLYIWVGIFVLAGAAVLVAQTRRAIRDFRGLREIHQMTPQQRSNFALEKYLRVSLPTWLYSSVNYEPTPEELLAVIREREQVTEGQTQAIVDALESNEGSETQEEEEEQPSISTLLSVTDRLTFSALGPEGKQMTMVLSDAVAPSVGFFATCEKGTWTLKGDVEKEVYDLGKDTAFAVHRQRANDQIIARMRTADLLPASVKPGEAGSDPGTEPVVPFSHEDEKGTEQTPSPQQLMLSEKGFNLFENRIEGQDSFWRLLSTCSVEVFPIMANFYKQVAQAQALPLADAPVLLTLEQLRQGCHHVMKEYGEGFLAFHMKKGYVWSWALPFYKHYREQCLAILAYANQREQEYLKTCETAKEKYEVIEHIAQLYGWQALVSTGLDLKDKGVYSERDMERCLAYYGNVKKRSAARAIYHRYCELRSRIDPTYEPGEALKKRADEVLASPSKPLRSHKTR
ncbi:hypothetical protein KSF_015950 [Reticulibacter mediterranei]|uniref:Uncharacterized protein n=1 Tax=Reticulibacter mediterranei TaxID=2778369 RepID=A0A8J3N1Q8_9CHLR|nr:hypothetical protein [Reticulibacter mediterranei]GHO91547.1 hypothetical protein KSF_015950 [Reticulibacter mediterranei]